MEEKRKRAYKEYLSDRKTAFTIVALTLAFVICIFLSFGFQFFIVDFNDGDFWGDLATKFALCVYCLYFGIPEARNLYMKKKEGRYQQARTKFIAIREKAQIQDNAFNQWLTCYYQKNKADYYKNILSLHGNINEKVLDLDYTELDNLKRPYKKSWENTEFEGRPDTYFRTMNDDQINIVKEIFNGKIVVEQIPNDFFKTLNGKVVSSEYVEQSRESRNKTRKYIFLIGNRVLLLFALAFVFAFFGIKRVEGDALTEVVKLFLRLWTMVSSFVYGFTVGKIMVQDQSTMLEYKTRVNELFLCDTSFKALSEDEMARKEYEKYEASVIHPEIVEQTPQLENNGRLIDYERN